MAIRLPAVSPLEGGGRVWLDEGGNGSGRVPRCWWLYLGKHVALDRALEILFTFLLPSTLISLCHSRQRFLLFLLFTLDGLAPHPLFSHFSFLLSSVIFFVLPDPHPAESSDRTFRSS